MRSVIGRFFCSITIMLIWPSTHSFGKQTPFDPGRTSFTTTFGEVINPYRELAVFVMPGQAVPINTGGLPVGMRLVALADGGRLHAIRRNSWTWKAPLTPGLYRLRLQGLNINDQMQFNIFVMHPSSQVIDGILNGYRIGHYPVATQDRLDAYRQPEGFVEVTPDLFNVSVSPHFRLGQFLCKQKASGAKYLVLRSKLPLKLEALLEEINARGIVADRLEIISGYRTPTYNSRLSNHSVYSRHLWGDAADIIIDQDGDGRMDDLNHDGQIDQLDSRWLVERVDSLEKTHVHLTGGIGRYKPTRYHGPFIHIDSRGFKARW